jgi:photosystem II stability/assembly factor-like uncharacterized protein
MPEGHDPLKRMWHVEPGHASQPATLWAGGDPGVLFRSDDGGKSWSLHADGLPEQAWVAVLREAMAYDADGSVYLGTQSGSVFARTDGS